MAKKDKAKKHIEVSIDTPNTDVHIERKENGNVSIEVETPKGNAQFTKTEDEVKLNIEIDDNAEYTFEGNGKSRLLPKGELFKVGGALLRILLQKKLGSLKK